MKLEQDQVRTACEDDLADRLRQAEDAVRARDDFLAIAAHELRSPMNALGLQLASMERLAEKSGDSPMLAHIRRARRNVERYVRRATLLLDVTRLNSADVQLHAEPVDVRALVASVQESHEDIAQFHGASLDFEVEGDLVGHWDAHMVEEILSNLVTNAIKYAGGRVHLRASAAVQGVVCFTVSDEGPGIPEDLRARIFARFERLVSPSRSRSGFGLGLWIVGRMVMAHQGSIQVQSGAGGGSVFTVNLPVSGPGGGNRGVQS